MSLTDQYLNIQSNKIPFGEKTVISFIISKTQSLKIALGIGNHQDRKMENCQCDDTILYWLENGEITIAESNQKHPSRLTPNINSNFRVRQGDKITMIVDLKAENSR